MAFPPKKPLPSAEDDALSAVMGGAPPAEEPPAEEEQADPVALLDEIQERVARLRGSLASA